MGIIKSLNNELGVSKIVNAQLDYRWWTMRSSFWSFRIADNVIKTMT